MAPVDEYGQLDVAGPGDDDDRDGGVGGPDGVDEVNAVAVGQAAEVRLWTDAGARVQGQVREIASAADPATRTFAVRLSIPEPPPGMRLGMTASVEFSHGERAERILLPLTSLVAQGNEAGVWVYEAPGAVAFRAIGISGMEGNALVVTSGLSGGERVVTAGAPLLRAGQRVKLLQDAPAP